MDELMSNPDLAALTGGEAFATFQESWLKNREATLEAIRTLESTEAFDENGHWVSHFQIGEAEITASLGIRDEASLLVYELSVNPYFSSERLTSGDSRTEMQSNYDGELIDAGNVLTVIEGNEWMRLNFDPDYF